VNVAASEPALDPAPIDEEVRRRVGRAWRELRRGAAMSALKDHLFGTGDDALEPGQMDTLDLLVQREAWRMTDLAEALRVDPSTATRAVQRLERSGLAERRPCDDDGRVVRVSITPAGEARHALVAERRSAVLDQVLAPFSPAERAELADLLDRFVAELDRVVPTLDQR
jgi:DNA-binding MarR family transcriptional regulator